MIYDVSPSIDERLAVWPGDTPPRREVLLDLARGDAVTLSTLHATVHLGAHADAASHYGEGHAGIDVCPLDFYLGRCQVIRVEVAPGGLVRPEDLRCEIAAPRVLIRTDSYPDPTEFREDFVALSPEFVQSLACKGVRLIGIDTPSVDPFASKKLPAHKMFLSFGMVILEGLVLREVPDGIYELIALPLKLVGFDASPVRAVLRTLP